MSQLCTLRSNEKLGICVEKIAMDEVPNAVSHEYMNSIYDFETEKVLYEVKSCHIKIKNGKGLPRRDGRFLIHESSHLTIKDYADNESKEAKYIFVLLGYANKIYQIKEMSWENLDNILKTKKPITRGDYQINYKLIFGEI